ncbi:MAG: type II secretion system protein GspG [Candidatus Muiribacteriota bacterium]
MFKKGFTLLELLIVIVVIGILAAVSVPRLMSFIDEGKVGATRSEMAAIKSAARLFFMHTNRYPTHVGELVRNNLGGDTGAAAISGWRGPYMEDGYEEVVNDAWGNEYRIINQRKTTDGGATPININGQSLFGILLVSNGPNGIFDGETGFGDEIDDLFEWLVYDGE